MVEVDIVWGIETLPYWPLHLVWDTHYHGCPRCQAEVDRAEAEGWPDTAALCPLGRDANEMIVGAIVAQRRAAAQN